MNNLKNKFLQAIKKPFGLVWEWIWSKLDNQFKKMCLISSIHSSIKCCSESDCDSLDILNRQMNLVEDVNAMRLPVLLGPYLWRNVIRLDKLDLEQDKAVERILRKLPCWIKYSDNDAMRSDIESLFDFYRNEPQAA